jgi:septal ring-binding cell division protein DamX
MRLRLSFTLLLSTLFIAGCASSGKPGAEQSAQQATQVTDKEMNHEELGFKHAETAYLAGDYEEAQRILQPLAQQGDAKSQYVLGYMYYYGQGVETNTELAKEWIAKAAEQGHEKAAMAMARFEDAERKQEATAVAGEEMPSAARAAPTAAPAEPEPATVADSTAESPSVMAANNTGEAQAAQAQQHQESQAMQHSEEAMAAATPAEPAFGSYEWVLAQPPVYYTIQLLATAKKDAAEDFIAEHGLVGQATIFQFQRDGKRLFSVIHGSYADRQLASAAVNGMSPALHRQAPWIRTFSGIQEIILKP